MKKIGRFLWDDCKNGTSLVSSGWMSRTKLTQIKEISPRILQEVTKKWKMLGFSENGNHFLTGFLASNLSPQCTFEFRLVALSLRVLHWLPNSLSTEPNCLPSFVRPFSLPLHLKTGPVLFLKLAKQHLLEVLPGRFIQIAKVAPLLPSGLCLNVTLSADFWQHCGTASSLTTWQTFVSHPSNILINSLRW